MEKKTNETFDCCMKCTISDISDIFVASFWLDLIVPFLEDSFGFMFLQLD